MKYNPDIAPDPTRWLDTDDEERARAIRRYHKQAKEPVGQNQNLHAAIHAVVENQLAEGHAAATAALSRLMAEGLDRHDAIHAIGAIVAAEMFDLMKNQVTHDPSNTLANFKRLRQHAGVRGRCKCVHIPGCPTSAWSRRHIAFDMT